MSGSMDRSAGLHHDAVAGHRPAVLFVCVRNGGKSQMAAGLLRHLAGDAAAVSSAGTEAGTSLNALSVEVLAELGIDISGQRPQQLTPQLIQDADLIVTLGRDAVVDTGDTATPVENWDIDEPSSRGVEGIERMRLVRDDIAGRVEALVGRLTRIRLRRIS